MKLIDIGFQNYLSGARIVSIASPDSSPIKRLVQNAKDEGRAIDATCGKKTRAVLITDSEHVVLSSLTPLQIKSGIEQSGG